jgi:phage virion morphogenesis protein
MSGARVIVVVDDRQFQEALSNVESVLDGDGRELMLEDMGEYMLKSTRDHAALEQDPQGHPWAPLSPRYARRKAKKRPGAPILVLDNHMLGDMLAYQVSKEVLYVGTAAIWGATHEFGRGGIPARPFLGVSETDATELTQIVHDHIQAAIEGSRS